MATLKIRMVIGLIALLIMGLGLEGYAHGLTGDRTPAGRQYNVCSNYAQGLSVAGNLPVTANVTAVPVKADAPDGQPSVAAYDITITNGGREWQPAPGDPVFVTLTDRKFVDGKLLDIYHQGPDGPEFVGTVMPENGTITFPAYSFSVYIVTESGPEARLTVNFHQADGTTVKTIYVKPNDIDASNDYVMFNKVVYDPGSGAIPDGTTFRGWTKDNPYTVESVQNAMTIEGVREDIKDILTPSSGEFTATSVDYYALVYKSFSVTYVDESSSNVVIAIDNRIAMPDATSISYTVYQPYTPEEEFSVVSGWTILEGADKITGYSTTPIGQNTTVTLTGNVTLKAAVETGHWLIFDENGKGATYNAPMFVKWGTNAICPQHATSAEMQRYGYTFDGWYNGYYNDDDGDPSTPPQKVLTTPFTGFGQPLTDNTTIFANWTPNTTADYTIMIWKQNTARNGYDFAASYSGTGTVGQGIAAQAITTGTTGDLTYVTIDGTKYGGITSVATGTTTDPFTGFTLSTANPIQDVVVSVDGNNVVNVYFDRVQYTLKMYVTRTNNSGTDYIGSNSGSTSYSNAFYGNWNTDLSYITRINGTTPTTYDVKNSYRYYYHTITAYYGQDISALWPDYSDIASSATFVSWILMPTAKAFVSNTSGENTVKGTISIMDEQVLGDLSDADGNFLTARYGNPNNWTYYIYFADADGNYPTTPNKTLILKSQGTNASTQHAPAYDGYTYDHYSGGSAVSSGNYTISYYYTPNLYSINFMNGLYVSGTGNPGQTVQNKSSEQLDVVSGVTYGSALDSYDYVPSLPEGEEGYMFEGWYTDKACTSPFVFEGTTMPLGGITIYAKWRQIRYRVFLHPNVPESDESLSWGGSSQAMNFGIAYGNKLSAPTGTRDNYVFVGWFKDQALSEAFNADAYVLNDETVPETPAYNKNTDYTDPMNIYGNITDEYTPYCSDLNRPYVTRKLDLYAKWRAIIEGADGINVTYDPGAGTLSTTDDKLYKDNTNAIGLPASTPTDNNLQFSYWEVLHYDETAGDYVSTEKFVYPGGPFAVLKDDAKKEQIGTDEYKYTVKLIAHYEPKEVQTLTFIKWYLNYNTPDSVYRLDNNLVINANVSIPEAPTRTGYTFKGWYKQRTETGNVPTIVTVTGCNPNFLYYNDGNYYSDASFTTVASYVAADEANLYDYLYAVWEPEITLSDATGCGTATLSVAEITGASCQWYSVTTSGETEISGATGFSYNAPASGTYKVVVTDAAGCTVSATADATVKAAPTVTMEGTTTCATTSGSFTLQPTVTNASGTVTYKWDDETTFGSNSSKVVSTVTSGTYTHTVTVQDARECPVEATATVTVNANPTIAIDTTRESCAGNDGSVKVTNVTGGTEPYSYVWTDGTNTVGTYAKAEGLTSLGTNNGRYYVTVTDANGCTASADAVIELYNPLVLNLSPTIIICTGNEFSITPVNGVDGNVIPDGTTYSWPKPEVSGVDGLEAGINEERIHGIITNNTGSTVTIPYEVTPKNGVCVGTSSSLTVTVTATLNAGVILNMPNTMTKCSNSENFALDVAFQNGINDFSTKWTVKEGTSSTETTVREFNNGLAGTQSDSYTIDLDNNKCKAQYTYKIEYTDKVTGCKASDECVITVNSGTWTIPADGAATVACLDDVNPPAYPTGIKDSCDKDVSVALVEGYPVNDMTTTGCTGTVTYKYRYTACDNTHKDWTFVYTIKDTVKPGFEITSTPAPTAIGNCKYTIPTVAYTAVTDCNFDKVTQDPAPGTEYDQTETEQTITITLTASDKCGKDSVLTTTVTIPAKPAVEVSAPTEEVCAAAEFTVTADITSGTPPYSYIWNNVPNSIEYANTMGTVSTSTITATASAYGCGDTKNVKIEVTDANGCVAEASTTVQVKSLGQPSISTALTDKNWGCTAPTTPQASDFTVENDECGNGTFSLTHGDTIKTDCTRSLKWTAYYRNRCGNSTTKEITYTWTVDTEAPVIADIPDQNATAIGSCKYQIPDLSAITLANTTETCHAIFVSQSRLSTEEIEQTNAQQTIEVTVTVKDDCDHEATQTVNVIIPAKSETTPAITLGDSVVCSGGSVTMKPTVTPTGYTYNWTWKEGTNTVASTQNYSVTPTATTTYTVSATATADNGCELEASKTVTVTVNDMAEATINGNDFCQGGSTTLNVPAGASAYAWAKDGTTITGANTNELNVTEAGTYTVTVTAEGGCTSVGSKTVNMNPLPTVQVAGYTGCYNSSGSTGYELSAWVNGHFAGEATEGYNPEDYSFQWKKDGTIYSTNPIITFNPIKVEDSGIYTLTVTETATGCSATNPSTDQQGRVDVYPLPTVTLTATTVCYGQTATITPTVSDDVTHYYWYDLDPEVWTEWDNPSKSYTNVGTYPAKMHVKTAHGCKAVSEVVTAKVNESGEVTVNGSDFCQGGSTTLSVDAGASAYAWAKDGAPVTDANANTLNVTEAGTYTVTVTDADGCKSVGSKTVKKNPLPTVTINNVPKLCPSTTSYTLGCVVTGTAPYTYAWSSASTDLTLDNTAIATPTATIPAVCDGSYTVKLVVTDSTNCSSEEASRTIVVKDETTPTITASTTSVNATPVAGCKYQVPDVTSLVTVSDACTKQTLEVTQNPAATTEITATQNVTVTVSDGCHTNTATISVVVPNAMALTALTGATVNPLCKGDANGSITVNAATGGTPDYTYAIDGGTSGTALTFGSLAAGAHTITATDAYGCSATLTVKLTEPEELTATVTTEQETCAGHNGKATVTAEGGTPGYTFLWSNGATTATQDTLTSLGTNNGSYTVTVTDAHNCSTTATATITLNNPLTMNELSTVICSGYEFTITPQNGTDGNLPAGTTYTWEAPKASDYPGVASGLAGAKEADEINGVITLNSSVTEPVTITYAVTPENGVCVGAATNVYVTVNATVNPEVTITIPHQLNKCNSGIYELTAEFVNGYSAYDVVWLQNGDTIASSKKHNAATVTSDVLTVNLEDMVCGGEYVYRVAYTDESGCTAADQCKITITSGTWSIGTPDGSSTVACKTDASAPSYPTNVTDSCGRSIEGVLLEGYPQDSPTTITCNGTRIYKYRYTACDGSYNDWTYTYTIKDTVKPNLEITNTPEATAAGNCEYKIPALTYNVSDCNTYTVTQTPVTGTAVQQINKDSVVTITLKAIDACGNDSTLTYTVTIPAKPAVEATVNPATICLDGTATVNATVTGTTATPTWTVAPTTGAVSGSTFTATNAGTYTLTASVTENGCTVSDDATVTVNPLPTLNITDATTTQNQVISYGTNIVPVEITNTNSNVTLNPAYGSTDWPSGFAYNETLQVITSNKPAAGTYSFVATATSLYGCGPVIETITVKVIEDSNPIVIRSSTKDWTYDGENHTDEVYTVTYDGVEIPVDATGKVFTLPTGDKVTITPTAAGVTHVDSYSENNTYTYTIEHGTQYTSVTTFVGTLSINCRKVTLTSGTDSKTYDGTELKKETVTVAGDGWLTGKEATYSNFASVTYVSSIENTFDYALAAGENADDYCVTVNNGTLTVTDGTGPGEDPVDPALVVSKTASTTSVYNLGDVVTFTVTATNIYNEPKTITFTELPGVTLSQSVFDNVASGETVTATATYTITENDLLEGSFTNTVTAQLGNIEKTADKTVNTEDPNGHLAVTKVATSTPADGTKYNLGETISYKVTVTNDGNLTITNITVTDPLTGDSWNVATLAPNAYEEFTTSHTVTEADILAGHVLNEATATGTSPDPKKPDVPVTPGSDDEPTGTAPLVIKINATKVYDGTPLQVPFDTITGVTTTGLMSGDALTAGSVTSSAASVGTYTYSSENATINLPFNTTYGISYYSVTYEINLAITCRKVELTSATDSKTYDGTALTNTTVTIDGDGWISGKEATYSNFASITNAGSTPNTFTYTLAAGENASDYCVTVNEGMLTVNKKALIIELDSTKVYDGTPFFVTYDQLHTTGLVNGDQLASGDMWSSADITPTPGQGFDYNTDMIGDYYNLGNDPETLFVFGGYDVGEYVNNDGSFEAMMATGVVLKSGFSVKSLGGTLVTSSYTPTFKVKLKIIKRPITITAASDSKEYDGTPLTNSGSTITAGSLAVGDSYTVTITGSQLDYGQSANVPSNAVIMKGGSDNVTDDYEITYVNGTLTVTGVSGFDCSTMAPESFLLNDCETSTMVTLAGEPTVTGILPGTYTMSNNLSSLNPLGVGTHTITWTLYDLSNNVLATCDQTITVDYKPCTGVTWQGHPYDAVRIGSQCWFTENLQWNTGSAVAYGEDAANVGKFGYLYTWYTAVGVPENDNTTAPTTQNDDCGNPYVQGICPPGWAVGSQADYDLLNTTAGSTSNLKDPSTEYWQAGYEGVTGGTGFNARGGGWYNSALSRYEDIMTGYHFWNSDSNPGTTVNSSTIVYYCDEILTVQAQKTDKMSVRCIRKKQ